VRQKTPCGKCLAMQAGAEYNTGLVYTDESTCIDCSKCIRGCPILRANVSVQRDDLSFVTCVDEKECILCGTCIKVCFREARRYRDDFADFISDLSSGKAFSAIIAPSFYLLYPDEFKHILGYLKSLGMKEFYPAGFGADIAVWGYVNYMREHRSTGIISRTCPSIVTYIEKHMPQLVNNLAPIQSPMMCMAIYLKKYLKVSDELVIISPCIVKKTEIQSMRGTGRAKYSITFKNILDHIKKNDVNLSDYEQVGCETEFEASSIFSVTGGLSNCIDYYFNRETYSLLVTGADDAYEHLKSYESDSNMLPELLDILNCKSGCVRGAGVNQSDIKVNAVTFRAHSARKNNSLNANSHGDEVWVHPTERIRQLNENFENLNIEDFMCESEVEHNADKRIVTEEEIEDVLTSKLLKHVTDARHIDCGACGYSKCRSLAEAIVLDINHKENCVNYTKSILVDAIESDIATNVALRTIIDIMPLVAIVIDEELNITESNGEALKMFEVPSTGALSDNFIKLSPMFQPDGSSSRGKAKQLYQEAYNNGISHHEWIHLNTKGEIIPCNLTAIRFDVGDNNNVICFIQDMRDYHKNLENTALMEQRLRGMLDASPILCAIFEENLNVIDANKAAATLFGLTDNKVYVERFLDLCPEFQPCGTPSRKKAHDVIARALKEGSAESEWMHCTLDKKTMIPCYCNVERVKLIGKTVAIAYVRDMRKEKDMINKLEETVAREQEANRAKSRFLASISHEIRTPMNAVMGISEIEIQKGVHPSETEDAFLRIYNSSNLLLAIINDILDLSKVESGRFELIPSIYETAKLIMNTMQLNLMTFNNTKIKIKLAIDQKLPAFMIGDELRIKQILNNLLSNAIKYTKEGDINLAISVHQLKGNDELTLQIKVSDTGQGMTKEQVDSLFVSEFTRFNNEENRNVQGSGLGLYITNRLVTMMDGDIYVESEKGVGSVFTVLLPQKMTGDEVLGKWKADRLQNLDTTFKSLRDIKSINYEPIPHGKVLIVDDSESNLYVAKEVLKPYQLSIDTASNGSEVITKIQNGSVYDVIFMDHMMPVMDGVEATRLLRLMGYNAPIVAFSANALRGAEEMFLESGFNDFVAKPIDTAKIEEVLTKYVRYKKSSESAENETSDAGSDVSNGDVKLSDELVKCFLKDVDNAVGVIESLVESSMLDSAGLKNYTVRVHALKNAFNTIGETNLSRVAAELEQAGNSENFTAIYGKTAQFLADTLRVAHSLRSVEADDTGLDIDENPKFVKEKLGIVRDACENFDTEVAEKVILEIEAATCSAQTKELLEALADHILCGEMDEAIERIDVWLEGR